MHCSESTNCSHIMNAGMKAATLRAGNTCRVCVGLAIVIFQMHCGAANARSQGNEQELDRLWAIWKSRQDEIQTAHVQFKYLIHSCRPNQPTVEQVDSLLTDIPAAIQQDGFEGIQRVVHAFLQLAKIPKPEQWYDVDLYVDGQRLRNRMRYIGTDELSRDVAFDGERSVHYWANNEQADVVVGQPKFAVITLASLRHVPHEMQTPYLRLTELHPPLATIVATSETTTSQRESIVSIDTGAVIESRTSLDRKPRKSIIYLEHREYPGGILFPSVIVSCEFTSDHVRVLEAFYVEDATFNTGLAPDAFTIPAPAGVTVLDHSDPTSERPRGKTINAPSADLLTDAPIIFEKMATSRRVVLPTFNWPLVMVANIGLVMLVVGIWLFRRSVGDRRRS